MPDRSKHTRRYRFGTFEVDFRLGELRKGGLRLRVGGQPLQVLEGLLERPGDVLTRDELRARLWPSDTFVDFEHNLNSAVKRLRTALGDSAEVPRYIETLPRRGYRFLVPVDVLPPAPLGEGGSDAGATPVVHQTGPAPPPSDAPSLTTSRSRPHGLVALLSLSVLIAVAWAVGGTVPAAPEPTGASLAVLPFENLTGDDDQDFLADGTTDALIAGLARVKSVTVISRTSVMRFRGSRLTVPEIARELGVSFVLEGSVRRSGDEIRITAQLIDAATDVHLWAETYSGTMADLLTLQARVARAVAREVRATLTPPEEARLASAPSIDPAAHEAYLKGRYFWNQRTREGLAQAIGYFEQALAIEPAHAATHAGLADAYNLLPRYANEPTRDALLMAREHALAALALDKGSAEAYAALAKVQHSLEWDWTGAERSFREAIDLSPGYATAHQWYSVFLLTVGRVDEGIAEASRARELDPLSPVVNLHLAYSQYLGGRLDESAAQVARTLELEPRYANAHFLKGWLRLREGELEAARAAFTTAASLTSNPREYLPGIVAVDVAEGRTADARHVLSRIEAGLEGGDGSRQPLVWALVALGDIDRAFTLVERDFEDRSVCFYLFHLTNHWFMAPLRADPRLEDLYQSAGLALQAGQP